MYATYRESLALAVSRHVPAALFTALLMAATPLWAQAPPDEASSGGGATAQGPQKPADSVRPVVIQHFTPHDQRGLNMFETPKEPGVEYSGFKLDFGAAFTSQVQALEHRNSAAPVIANGVNTTELADIGFGFNNSTANLYLHAQLADGVRVQLASYLSSRHHNETWVKDGFLLIDKLPINAGPLNLLMEFATIKVGHFEINYGDAHFRRSDNGSAMFNPFVGNYVLDAFTTEIGGEVYLRHRGVMLMGSVTGGEVRGTVLAPGKRGPAFIGKAGFDRQLRPTLRVRVTGSGYRAAKALNSTLYGGDRAGSRYYYVLENTQATESAQFTSGAINPGFRNEVTAVQLNPFVKFRRLEVFGVIERAKGRASSEPTDRIWRQYAADVVYRFFPRDQAYAGVRYNEAFGDLAGLSGEVGARRWHLAAGWFVTPNVLMKTEYVTHAFSGYPIWHVRHGGRFNGLMLEGVVGF